MRTIATLLLTCFLVAPTLAQDAPPDKPIEKIDVKKLKDKVELPPVRADQPPAVPPSKIPPRRKLGEYTKAENEEIDRNMRRALDNYNSIIEGEDVANLDTLEKRIQSNLALRTTQHQRLSKTQQDLRKLRIVYTRRYLVLRESYRQGRLDKKTYTSRLRQLASEFDFRSRSLVSDVKFYRKELGTTRSRVKNLQQIHRLNQMTVGRRKSKQPQELENSLERMLNTIRSAGRFRVKNVLGR